jgi:acrylyl-CoA reductase (NADPH)
MNNYKALSIAENEDGKFIKSIETLNKKDLPQGELLIRVQYSSLNYKDGLSASGNKGVTKNFPHTPGIDAAGIVESSSVPNILAGDEVIVTGYDLGMDTPGGFGQYISIPAAWAVPRPQNLSLRESMIIGTAGLTAALCVEKLQKMGLTVGQKIVISGASGGVGSFAVALLHKLGCQVIASTGSPDKAEFLNSLGATEIIDRSILAEPDSNPFAKEQWDGAIDTAGGHTLANIIKGLKHSGSVAAVGLVESAEIPVSIFPFLLRGVNLLGIDSVQITRAKRLPIWELLADNWKLDNLEQLATEIKLEEVAATLDRLLQGKTTGRILVTHH